MYENDQDIMVTIVTNEGGHHLLVNNCHVTRELQLVRNNGARVFSDRISYLLTLAMYQYNIYGVCA